MVISKKMFGDTVECYIDDLVVKSGHIIDNLEHLTVVFDKPRQNQLKMNPQNCESEVTSSKFIGFVVHLKGIEVNHVKIKEIIELPPPKNIWELRGFRGHITCSRRFIFNLFERCQTFSKVMKKDAPFKLDEHS